MVSASSGSLGSSHINGDLVFKAIVSRLKRLAPQSLRTSFTTRKSPASSIRHGMPIQRFSVLPNSCLPQRLDIHQGFPSGDSKRRPQDRHSVAERAATVVPRASIHSNGCGSLIRQVAAPVCPYQTGPGPSLGTLPRSSVGSWQNQTVGSPQPIAMGICPIREGRAREARLVRTNGRLNRVPHALGR